MLVGAFISSEKYARQIGSFPQIGMNIKKYLKPPPSHQFSASYTNPLRIQTPPDRMGLMVSIPSPE